MLEYTEGGNRISVDILDRNRDKVGPGPLLTCLGFSATAALNHAGDFTARFPANDPRLQFVQLKRHFLLFYVDGDLICYGLAESWDWQIDNDGQQILVISGRDALAELDETTIDYTRFVDGTDPVDNAPTLIFTAYNALGLGTLWGGGGITETPVYGATAGESALHALTRIAEEIGESFRLFPVGGGSVEWLGTSTPDSLVRAVQGAGDPLEAETNYALCFIQHLTERRDATRMITKIFPYGSGLGETRLDLTGTTRVAPAGFIYNPADNSISSDAAFAYIGKTIGRHVNFKDIRPLFNTDADIQAAKDYLFNAALAYLQRNDSIDDIVEYDLDVLQLPPGVLVGMTLRVVFQDERHNLDEDLVVLAIRTNVGGNGERTYQLTVSPINQWRFRETHANVSQMEEGEIFAAHPQIDASAYWMVFREEVGEDQIEHLAEFPFWLSAEIVTIRQVLFRFMVDRLLSAVGVVSYASPNTDAPSVTNSGPNNENTGPESVPNSGQSNVNTGPSSVPDSGQIIGNTGPSTGNTGTNNDTSGPASITLTDDGGAGNTLDPTVTETDDVTGWLPGAAVTLLNGTGTTFSTDSLTALSWSTSTELPSNTLLNHIHTHNHAHSAELPQHFHGYSHTHDMHHVHGLNNHQHNVEHTHTLNNHVHSLNSHIHSLGNHTHTIAHTHTLNNHTHTIAHVHTLNNHVHTIAHIHAAPDLVTTYTMRRTPVGNSYAIGDLEYSVNGGAWADLDDAIPVAGGYLEFDITSHIQNPAGLKRPNQEYNLVQVRRKTAAGTGKTCMIRAQIGIRATIQSVVVYN